MPERILIIEDDAELSRLLEQFLIGEGFAVTVARDGDAGLIAAKTGKHTLIVLDLMLPKRSGLDVIRGLRPQISTPIIVVTARGDPVDRIVGLELGADDYIPKPFDPRELVARIRAVLRRAPPHATGQREVLRAGPLTLDLDAHSATLEGQAIALSALEFALLRELCAAAGRVLSRDFLLERVRQREYDVIDRSIDMHISHIRQKLGDDPKQPRWIKTVRSVGYMFVQEVNGA